MDSQVSGEETHQDLFTQEDLYSYEDASTGQRFLNLVIDVLFMQYGLGFLTGYLAGLLFSGVFPEDRGSFFQEGSFALFAFLYFVSILNYLIYYTFCEKVFKGITLGKLITGTRAVRNDGSDLSFKDALMRTLSRIVPFEAFSGFGGHPWHDQWTKTMVIKTRK
jgi:uncharacterized RDD family membrane protein YckC